MAPGVAHGFAHADGWAPTPAQPEGRPAAQRLYIQPDGLSFFLGATGGKKDFWVCKDDFAGLIDEDLSGALILGNDSQADDRLAPPLLIGAA